MTRAPLLSIIVIVYDMPRQAMNTLRSLSTAHQRHVNPDDYEVIVVENRSPRTLDADAVAALPGHFRYFLRDEPGVSPAAAINFGFARARGGCIGLMVDGARMVTPGVVHHVLAANRVTTDALVVVPGYNLGPHEHQLHATHGYTEEAEQALLRGVDWERDGYALFSIACISGANRYGIFHPFMECNCLFLAADVFRDIGAADERFDLPGGGALNLALYRKAALHPRTRLFVLPGEGSFHQLHGGVTTSEIPDRDDLLARIRAQLHELLGRPFTAPLIEPTFLGTIDLGAMRHLQVSLEHGLHRHQKCRERNQDPHVDESRKRAASSPHRPTPPESRLTRRSRPMNPVYMPPSIRRFEPRHIVFSTWIDHLPFGYDLVAAIRPKMLVELGTHKGLSYFTFCQAMKEHGIDGLCYAVDTFEGDEHTDKYDESVFKAVNAHNREHYHGFSYLMRMRFNDALQHFADGSVDLVHIDGLHTYEAVSEDFANWLPKVRPGGVMLFHDVRARVKDFGVWRFWDELQRHHETFTFDHGFGLGVLRKAGGDREHDPEILDLLFTDRGDAGEGLRAFYVHASKHLNNMRKLARLEAPPQAGKAA